jgi:tRNA-(ms[2]io[6]A)-hydroxylase
MKLIPLKSKTSMQWVETVLADFNAFLADHASCEHKASVMAMSLIHKYPEKQEMHDALLALAIEELEHFRQVYRLMRQRNIALVKQEKDLYANALLKLLRHGRSEETFLDKALVCAIIEARGTERLALLGEKLEDPTLKDYYTKLAIAESRHYATFAHAARHYIDEDILLNRLDELLEAEAEIISKLPLKARVH